MTAQRRKQTSAGSTYIVRKKFLKTLRFQVQQISEFQMAHIKCEYFVYTQWQTRQIHIVFLSLVLSPVSKR